MFNVGSSWCSERFPIKIIVEWADDGDEQGMKIRTVSRPGLHGDGDPILPGGFVGGEASQKPGEYGKWWLWSKAKRTMEGSDEKTGVFYRRAVRHTCPSSGQARASGLHTAVFKQKRKHKNYNSTKLPVYDFETTDPALSMSKKSFLLTVADGWNELVAIAREKWATYHFRRSWSWWTAQATMAFLIRVMPLQCRQQRHLLPELAGSH